MSGDRISLPKDAEQKSENVLNLVNLAQLGKKTDCPPVPSQQPIEPPQQPIEPPPVQQNPQKPQQPPCPPPAEYSQEQVSPPAFLELPAFEHEHKQPRHNDAPTPSTETPPHIPEVPPTLPEVPPIKPVVPPHKLEQPPVIPPAVKVPAPEPTPIQTMIHVPEPAPNHPALPPIHVRPHPVKPEVPPPTGIWTGQGHPNTHEDTLYKRMFSSGKYESKHHEHLEIPALKLRVDVDKVGTGKDQGMRKHRTEMVPPHQHQHVGEWKYEVPGKTILAGHVRYNGEPGPLYKLRELGMHGQQDKVILQDATGKEITYAFAGRTILKNPHDQSAWNKIFAAGNPDRKQLVIVTCCGPVDSHGVHPWRLVVYANEVQAKTKHHAKGTGTAHRSESPGVPPMHESANGSSDAVARAHLAPVSPAQYESRGVSDTARTASTPPSAHESPTPAVSDTTRATSTPPSVHESPTPAVSDTTRTASTPPSAHESPTPAVSDTARTASTPPSVDERHGDLQVITNTPPGSAPGTRVMYTAPFEGGSIKSLTGEVGVTGGKLAYGQLGPNFSFLNDDKYTASGSLRLGLGTGETFKSANVPLQGMSGLSLSGQLVGTDRIGPDSRLYAGGGFGLQPFNQTRYQGFVEAGATHEVSDKLSLRLGVQGSQVQHEAFGTYGVAGIQYRPNRASSIGLTIEQPLNHSRKPTAFLGASFSF